MTASKISAKLPEHVANKIKELVYPKRIWSSDPQSSPNDDSLLQLTNILAPYYPLDETQKQSVLALRRWQTTQEMLKASREPIQQLQQVASSAVDAWERQVERQNDQRRYRGEYDERRQYLFKELRHRLEQGDYRVIEELITQLLPTGVQTQLPTISIPPELAQAVKELALKEQEQLSKLIDETASARQTISEYVYKIVADENIEPAKEPK